MRLALCLSGCLALTIIGCGGGGSSPAAPSTTDTKTTTMTPTTTTPAGCTITASTPGGAVTGANGPYYHHLAIASTTNGIALTGASDSLDHASVPDATVLPDGSIGVYYVNGETDGIWLARISGTTATPVSAIKIDGFIRPQGAVDPDAFLINGKVRLTYLYGFGSSGGHRICMAESSDGVNFTSLGLSMSFTGQSETDPSVAQAADGTWLMAVSRGTSTMLARSSDGLTFTEFSQVTFGGVPELAALGDGRVRLYVCSTSGGLAAYASSNSGASWTSEGSLTGATIPGRPGVCDPSALLSRNLFVFKTQ